MDSFGNKVQKQRSYNEKTIGQVSEACAKDQQRLTFVFILEARKYVKALEQTDCREFSHEILHASVT